LKAGDRVVVEGFQKFAAGDKVAPRAWTEAADATMPSESSSAAVQR
jgi:membrane fusion protein, multidrug efflux system